MLALTRINAGHTDEAAELLEFIHNLIQATPALSHPAGEEWTFSILVTTVALAAGGHLDTANKLVERTAVWLLDWIENGLLLPPVGASTPDVIDRMLATAYKPPSAPSNKAMYSFAVVADLAGLLTEATATQADAGHDEGDRQCDQVDQGNDVNGGKGRSSELFVDIINDLHALRAMATLKVPPPSRRAGTSPASSTRRPRPGPPTTSRRQPTFGRSTPGSSRWRSGAPSATGTCPPS